MAKRVELLYLDNTLGQWANARYRFWKTALDPDDWASVTTDQGTDINPITALHITDAIGNPRKAQVTIINRPRQMGSTTANEGKGRFTGVFTDFQSVRLRDPETGTILLAGKIYNVDEKFDFQYGTSIVLDIRDAIQELIDTRTAHWPDKEQTGGSTTRSAIINDIIAGNRNYTFSSLIATDGQNKVTTSLRKVESTGVREFKGNKSALAEISTMAAEEPHSEENSESHQVAQLDGALDGTETDVDIDGFYFGYANAGQAFAAGDLLLVDAEVMKVVSIASDTLTVVRGVSGTTADSHGDTTPVYKNPGASKYGFDYHVDAAVETTSVSATPAADWNYYKRGSRPDSPKNFGMTVKYPASASFTPDGFNKMMQNDFSFSNPKEELYTDVILEYTEKGPEVKGDGTVNAKASGGASTPKRRKFERLDIIGASGRLSVEGMIKLGRTHEAGTGGIYNTTDPVTFTIDEYDIVGEANTTATAASDLVNAGDYIRIDNEILYVTARGTGDFTITVDRAALGTTAANHTDNTLVYRNPHAMPDDWGAVPFGQTEIVQSPTGNFGFIEYQSHTAGSSLENNDPPGFIIVSPYNNPQDTDDILFNAHMPETSVTVTGTETSNTVTTHANCRYAKTIGLKKTKVIKNTTSSEPADLRKQVIGFLSRNTQTSVKRGEFKVTGYPFVYLEIPADKLSTSGSNTVTFTSDAFTNNAATPATSQDPRDFGVLSGDVICEMDSTGTTITRYAYISSVTATTVVFGSGTTDTSDGTILDQTKPMRIYVPLRAGHVIRVTNSLAQVDADHLVTELAYDEGSGVAMTSLSTTGQYDTAVSFKPNILKAVNNNAISYGKEPPDPVINFNDPGNWSWDGEFIGTAYDAISWGQQQDGDTPSGNIKLWKEDGSLGKTLEIVAGSSTGLTAQTNYIAYLAPTGGSTESIVVTKASAFKKNKNFLQLATIYVEENDASFVAAAQTFPNIISDGGRNIGIKAKPDDVLTPGTITVQDGTAAAPSVTFAGSADGETGLFLYESGATEYLGISADGTQTAYFGESGANIWLYRTTQPGADDTYDLGTASYRWDDVYATNGTIQTSDMRLKELITPLTLGLGFVNDLNPVSYKWKNKKEDKVDQTHYGIIAQEVMETLKKHGINSIEEFGGITHGGEDEDYYGARYSEFIPMLIKAVQELSDEVKQLKEKN